VQAPDSVKEEILLVWQEDEMPDEVKNAPGYVPFTLSPGAEDWLAGMAEIKELPGSDRTVIVGRPRPPVPRERRSLIPTPAPSPAPPPAYTPAGPPPAPAPALSTKEWVRRQAPRNVPAIAERDAAAPVPPSVEPRREEVRSLPDIGGETPPAAPEERPTEAVHAVPQIGGEPPAEPSPPPEQSVQPRAVPQIGPVDEDT
jgi:hypothetical protein